MQVKKTSVVHLEERTARLTLLIDPRKKVVFERLCAQEDLTSSQVVRRMIRAYIEERLGRSWTPGEEGPVTGGSAWPRRNQATHSSGVTRRAFGTGPKLSLFGNPWRRSVYIRESAALARHREVRIKGQHVAMRVFASRA